MTTFVTPGYRFDQKSIDAIELLQYRIVVGARPRPLDAVDVPRSYLQSYAELVLRPARDKMHSFSDTGIQQYIVKSKSPTAIISPW